VSESTAGAPGFRQYEVGVAIMPLDDTLLVRPDEQEKQGTDRIPGYDEALGRSRDHGPGLRPALIEKGEEAVRAATEAIASQIGLATQRIARAVAGEAVPAPCAGELGLESVQVSFGVTLTAGVQTLFTAQAGSSVLVTLTLSRSPGNAGHGGT
jgi:Trypsin-co-occurring domain 1